MQALQLAFNNNQTKTSYGIGSCVSLFKSSDMNQSVTILFPTIIHNTLGGYYLPRMYTLLTINHYHNFILRYILNDEVGFIRCYVRI